MRKRDDAPGKRLKGMQFGAVQFAMRRRSVPGGAGGGGGGRSELVVLLWAAVGGGLGGGPLSFIPNSLDSLERVRGSEDPREALGDSVFRVLEL